MRWSLRYQLLVPLVTLLLAIVGLSTWTALASAAHAREQMNKQVRNIVRTLRQASYPLTESVLLSMKGLSGADYLLLNRDRHDVTTLPSQPRALPEIVAGEHWEHIALEEQVSLGKSTYLAVGVQLEQTPNSGTTLYIFYPESLWQDALWESVRPSLLMGITFGLAAMAFTIVAAQRLTRRVRELERRTRLIAAGDFSPMPLPHRNDELRDLSQAVNEMAQKLAQFQETVRITERLRLLGQVSGGLAHQLRNGVTGARLAVQLHARECTSTGDREPLDVALRQLALVETHLKRFLDLGRQHELRKSPCNLATLIEETVQLLRPQCRHAGIELQWRAPESATPAAWTLAADPGQLGHLLLNVTTNAIEAAGPGGTVAIQLAAVESGQQAQIHIDDSGAGPPAAVAERLFEPFVTGKPEGIGLGLAVARQVAEAHGGSLGWQRRDGMTRFTITLPLEEHA